MHRCFLYFITVVCLGAIGMSNASEPSISQEDAFATAFAEAKAEIERNIELACKEALVKAKRTPVRYLPDGLEMVLQSPATWPSNLQSRVAITRAVAEKLAEEQGEAIVPYLLKRAEAASTHPAGETRMLALLTLDKLEQHDKLARVLVDLAFRERPSYSFSPRVWVLLEVSFCSEKTRLATANLLVKQLLKQDIYSARSVHGGVSGYLVYVGNVETIDLLNKRAAQITSDEVWRKHEDIVLASPRKHGRNIEWARKRYLTPEKRIEWAKALRRPYEQAIARLQSRLSLPEKEREQRTKDELLFWQTGVGAPRPVNPEAGLRYAVESLAFQKLSISTDFLIEQLKNAKDWDKENPRESQVNWNRVHLALMFIASQKENRAVPAMVALARRIPHFHQKVNKTLGQLGTPEAKEALLILEASKKKQSPRKGAGSL